MATEEGENMRAVTNNAIALLLNQNEHTHLG